MPVYVKDSGTWSESTKVSVKDSGSWSSSRVHEKGSGSWNYVPTPIDPPVTPTVTSSTVRKLGYYGTLYSFDATLPTLSSTSSLTGGSVYIDPNNTSTFFRTYFQQGSGYTVLERSTNTGASFSTIISSDGGGYSGYYAIGQMSFQYSGSGIIWASRSSGSSNVFKSTNYGSSFTSVTGFGGIGAGSITSAFNNSNYWIAEGGNQVNNQYYTSNGGTTWALSHSGDNSFYTGSHNYVMRSTNWTSTGIYYSTSWPPSWTASQLNGSALTSTGYQITSPFGNTSVAYMLTSYSGGNFAKSTDNGATFSTSVSPASNVYRMGSYGVYVWLITKDAKIYYSSDYGSNFSLKDDLSSVLGTDLSVSANSIGNNYYLSVHPNGKSVFFNHGQTTPRTYEYVIS